jgi:phenylalanyl-tRNA synthetase beta chain
MVKRLEAAGMRSVNNVVDATNYAMLETGQPPHAFDYEKIADRKIIVRKAVAGETLISIDGTKCELDGNMLIIADGRGPVAIAGVMGGLDTEVSETTKTILLEDAYFDPVSVRTTSRKLTLLSEASFRFERIVDIERVDWASQRTAQLIVQAAGGKAAKGVVDVYPKKPAQKEVTLRLGRMEKLLGIKIAAAEAVKILSRLGFQPRHKGEEIICTIPSWRRTDVCREADLIEEVARVYGYNKIPAERKIRIEIVPVDERQRLVEVVGTYLNGCGFYETVTVGFTDERTAGLFAGPENKGHLAVKDVSRKSVNLLRQSLLGSLFGVLKTNLNAGNTPCRIFEIADTFVPAEKGLPIEKTRLSLVCDCDLRYLRGVIEGLIKNIDSNAEAVFNPAKPAWAEAGAEITVNGDVMGFAGVISQAVREGFDFKETMLCGAELEFEKLMAMGGKAVKKVRPIAKYPGIKRDLSIVVDEKIRWADIMGAINKKASAELEGVHFVEIYRGKGIAAGKKSVTLSLQFRDEDGTLTHEQVDNFQANIVDSLNESVGAELRTI